MTQTELEKLAASILLASENPLHFPVDLRKLAKSLHAKVVKSDLCGESGYIISYKGAYLICVDTDHHRVTHNRFTIAHELAHIALGHLGPRSRLSDQEKEREANYLAGAILMPFHFMAAYHTYDTRILSSFMAVSEEAMEVRRRYILRDPLYYKAIDRGYYKDELVRDLRGGL